MGNSKMDEVQRFDQRCFAGHYEGIAPDAQGDYVLFDDYVKLRDELKRLQRDAERLEFMLREKCVMYSQKGTNSPVVYSLAWPAEGEQQAYWFATERDAIDDAMFHAAAQGESHV